MIPDDRLTSDDRDRKLREQSEEIKRLRALLDEERRWHEGTSSVIDGDNHFRSFAELHPIGIFVVDREGRPFYANRASTELLGQGIRPDTSRQDLAAVYRVIRADTKELYPNEQLPVVRALRGEHVYVDDLAVLHPDREVPLEVWATPVYAGDGAIQFAIAAFADITERRAAELKADEGREALETFSRRLKTIHELNTRFYGKIGDVFEAFLRFGCEIFSMTTGIVSRIDGNDYTVVGLRSDLPQLEVGQEFGVENTYCSRVLRSRRTITYTHVGGEPSMRSHPVYVDLKLESYVGTPIYVDGEVVGTLNFSSHEIRDRPFREYDIEIIESMADSIGRYVETDRIEQQREGWRRALIEANAELARSNQELDDFAYIASHDLKEPLRGIANYSRFLEEDYGQLIDSDGKSMLATLARLSNRMEELIDSLLFFSRVGRAELSIEDVNLNVLVRDVAETVRLSNAGAKVDIQVRQPLPVVKCDRVRVREVFQNLIANAVKYNDKDQKCIEIGVKADKTNGVARKPVFFVRDNGIGIAEKHAEAIFRIFKRLHRRDEFGGGTGAGLTIAKKIIERHGGKIWVESEPGRGATFYFTLR